MGESALRILQMTVSESSAATASDVFPEGSVEAGRYATAAEAFEHSLVVLAMGEDCWIIPTEDGHYLRVEPGVANEVRRQLEFFDVENSGWPPRGMVEKVTGRKRLPVSPLVWVLAVFATFWAQGEWPGLAAAGALDAGRVFGHGEWWRAATALWLHGDLGHLVSNAGGGLLVFSALVATFGLATGWGWLAVSAFAGNVVSVAAHYGDEYRSLGSSTAIFAALGMLVGRAARVVAGEGWAGQPQRWRTVLVPLATGLVVLGLNGAGGENTDVLAHATGFGAGLVTGFAAGGNPSADESDSRRKTQVP